MITTDSIPAGSEVPGLSPEEWTPADAAATYASMGWFVAVINGVHGDGTCRCPKAKACGSAGKHPIGSLMPKGYKDASRYGPTLARWWRLFPDANIGVVTGPSGLASLDVDPRNGGNDSFARLVEEHGPLSETLHLLTGGNGHQYIFSDPDRTVKKWNPMPGIDILGGSCLFVAAPSRHRSGGTYSWANWGTDLAPVPAWMIRTQP